MYVWSQDRESPDAGRIGGFACLTSSFGTLKRTFSNQIGICERHRGNMSSDGEGSSLHSLNGSGPVDRSMANGVWSDSLGFRIYLMISSMSGSWWDSRTSSGNWSHYQIRSDLMRWGLSNCFGEALRAFIACFWLQAVLLKLSNSFNPTILPTSTALGTLAFCSSWEYPTDNTPIGTHCDLSALLLIRLSTGSVKYRRLDPIKGPFRMVINFRGSRIVWMERLALATH
jgi:hypothetical protein